MAPHLNFCTIERTNSFTLGIKLKLGGEGVASSLACRMAATKKSTSTKPIAVSSADCTFAISVSEPLTPMRRSRQPLIFYWSLVMKIERFVGYNEAREALVLSVAGVTAIMLTAYLLLLILY
jgi:hypothetical protein